MRDILFLSHRIPFPPDKGDKIRSWHIFHRLATHHRVHLGCLIDDNADTAYIPVLRKLCASCRFARLSRFGAQFRSIGALAKGEPLTFAHFRQKELIAWVAATHRRHHIAAQFIFSAVMAPYAETVSNFRGIRIVDFVDVDSDKWAQYARSRSWPLSWIYSREARLLAVAEHRIAENANISLFVSEDEADLFRRRASSHVTVLGMANGVDTTYFDPVRDYPNPYAPDYVPLTFVGRMDYWANIDAVMWFSNEVLPLVQQSMPSARFFVVGAEPTRRVQALADGDRVVVTGRVSDVRPYLAHAALAVAPLRIARGIQNKALEAMAMGKAVVATPQAFEGIEATPGHDIVVAESAKTFAAAVAGLLHDVEARGRIGAQARALVARKYRWDSRLEILDRLVEPIDADGAPRRATGG